MSGAAAKEQSGLFNNSASAQGLASLYGQNAAAQNAVVTPGLTTEAVAPQGYTPNEKAAQRTAAEQSAGGSNAGAAGGAMLRATRTRNVGAAPAAISASNRAAGNDLSQINAGIETKNADLKEHQRQAGLSGLAGLYGENVGAGENAIGLSSTALKDAGSISPFWQSLLLQGVKSGGEVASAYAQGGGGG